MSVSIQHNQITLPTTSVIGAPDTTSHRDVFQRDSNRITTSSLSPNSNYDGTTTSYEHSRRQVSSVVVSEKILGDLPESGGIRYVEVPVVEEVVRIVPKYEVREVEKIVPKYEVEYIERIVEVPQIHYVDRTVEIPQVQEVIKTVGIKQVVPREVEVVKRVPNVQFVNVEKIVEVRGEIIEQPRHFVVENKIAVKNVIDRQLPVVVAQTIRPLVVESNHIVDVDIYEYEPEVIPVDVHVAKPIASHMTAIGVTQEIHQDVRVPAAQYNTILKSINTHLSSIDIDELPYLREGNNVPFLAQHETPGTAVPAANLVIHPMGTANQMSTTQMSTNQMSTNQMSTNQMSTNQMSTNQQLPRPTMSTASTSMMQPMQQQPMMMQQRNANASMSNNLMQNGMPMSSTLTSNTIDGQHMMNAFNNAAVNPNNMLHTMNNNNALMYPGLKNDADRTSPNGSVYPIPSSAYGQTLYAPTTEGVYPNTASTMNQVANRNGEYYNANSIDGQSQQQPSQQMYQPVPSAYPTARDASVRDASEFASRKSHTQKSLKSRISVSPQMQHKRKACQC